MKVTYIYHSSFLVELDSVNLLFDYYKGEIPTMDLEKPLIVFASHVHGDHFSKKIFKLMESHSNIQYILSDDIEEKNIPSHCREKVLFVHPNEKWKQEIPELEIETFHSTDEGVAFWICCEGKTIYHAGDLHFWFWKGECDEWNQMIADQYHKEIGKLKGRHANIAFLVLDPRQEEAFYFGINDFMKIVSADHIVPMHCWGDYSVISKMKQLSCARSYQERIAEIQKEGDTFEWNN